MPHILFKKIWIFFFVFFLLSVKEKINAQNWPALFENRDFYPVAEENSKDKNIVVDESNIEKASPELVRKKLAKSFYFISDFISETLGERPRGWVDPKTDPQKALELGYPQVIKRPSINIHFPVYNLLKLPYFKGDSPINSSINICQNYWLQARYQETFNCFAKLQVDIEKGQYEITPLVKMQFHMLEGFFLLYLLTHNETNVKNISLTTDPPTFAEFKEGEMLEVTRVLFRYVLLRFEDELFIPKQISNDIMHNYAEFYQYPQYLIKGKLISEKISPLALNKESLDALTWVRSVMPLVYINIFGLHNSLDGWRKGFEAIDKLENYLERFQFPKQGNGSALRVDNLVKVKSDIYLKPENNLDTLVMADLYKALAFQRAREPDTALKYISRGVLRNGDPDLGALLFKASADAYYDLNILQLARRSYSWSELYAKDFTFKVPSTLFFGAESAFWLGQYEVAKNGFKSFLLASGDKEYAPRALLRLASIEQLWGHEKTAQSLYEKIVRNFEKHEVAHDAAVNLFCLNVNHLSSKVKKIKYKNIIEKLALTRTDLKRQAKACLMSSDLMDATQNSYQEDKKNVVEKAKIQKDMIQKYEKEFPDSEFIVLFAERMKHLELSQAALLASQNKCKDLISYYEKNKVELNLLSKNNNKYVAGLKWDKTERKKLLRCAALLENFKLWGEARRFDIGKEGNPLQDKYYILSTRPSSQSAFNIYVALKKSAQKWNETLEKFENSGTEMTERPDFWELLSLQRFLNFKIAANKTSRDLLANAIAKDLLKEPKRIFEFPLFCSWFIRDFSKLRTEDFDIIAQLKSSQEWLELLSSKKGNSCETTVAQNLFSQSFKNPSFVRDKLILLPSLEKRGFAGASEDWLTYVQRLEQERGVKDKDVVDIYRNLSEKATDSLVKNAALFWFKKNFPKAADKVLW